MNLIDSKAYTNLYIRASEIRCILHDFFINDKFNFARLLTRLMSLHTGFKVLNTVEDEITFSFDTGDISKLNIDIRNIYTIKYVEVFDYIANDIKDIIESVYETGNYDGITGEDLVSLEKVYNFIKDLGSNKSPLTMLFDIRVYMDHLILII